MRAAATDSSSQALIATAAMTCNLCFDAGPLKRFFVDLPQPRYVGPGYTSASPRIAWVMINPGAGQADVRNQSLRDCPIAFREGRLTLNDVYAEQRRHMPYWNSLMPFIEAHGLDPDSIAIVNVAWCASEGKKYPEIMLDRCWRRHTAAWLTALGPGVVILSG